MKLFASRWHKADWMGHPMRLELTLAGLLVKLANHYTTRGALYLSIYLYLLKSCYITCTFNFDWFGLVGFYSISTIVGYLMLNPLYTYVLNIYDLVLLGFMAYQPL